MGQPTDEELMERFCQGDAQAFDALFVRKAPELQAFLTRLVRDPALAEDLLQLTFLSVSRSRDRFERGARVSPWLYAIAANAARDALRRRKRTREEAASVLEALPADAAPERDPALARRLDQALATLPLPQREAVVLHHVMGWSFEEMAAALGTTSTAMRIRAHRGYEKLRVLLAPLREAP